MPSLPSLRIRSPSWMPFTRNRLNEEQDNTSNADVTGPNALPDVFSALSDNSPSVGQPEPIQVDTATGPSSPVPDVGTEEQFDGTMHSNRTMHSNGTTHAASDAAFQPLPTIQVAQEALDALKKLLKPPRDAGGGRV